MEDGSLPTSSVRSRANREASSGDAGSCLSSQADRDITERAYVENEALATRFSTHVQPYSSALPASAPRYPRHICGAGNLRPQDTEIFGHKIGTPQSQPLANQHLTSTYRIRNPVGVTRDLARGVFRRSCQCRLLIDPYPKIGRNGGCSKMYCAGNHLVQSPAPALANAPPKPYYLSAPTKGRRP